jgi:hypothetical protein
MGEASSPLSDADKNGVEWQKSFEEYVEAIGELHQSPEETDLDLIRKKWQLMGGAVLLAPAGPERDRALQRYVSLFKISNMPEDMLPVWYNQVRSLIDLSEKFNHGRAAILKLLQDSHDSLLILVARLSAS